MLFSSTLITLGALAAKAVADLSHTGNVTFFSDDACADPVFVNSAIIGRDFCATSDSDLSSLGPYRGFIINERPWCDNGSRPYWNVFGDGGCRVLLDSFPPMRLDGEGACVPVGSSGFRSYAFVCDGFDLAWGLNGPGNDDGEGEDGPPGDDGASSRTTEDTTSPTDGSVQSTTHSSDVFTITTTDAS